MAAKRRTIPKVILAALLCALPALLMHALPAPGVAASPAGAYVPPLTIVCAGDSHTYGNADPADAWPLKLAALSPFAQVKVVNIGMNGWTSSQVQQDYPLHARLMAPANTHRAAIYWLHTGGNDVGESIPAATTYATIEAILTQAVADGFQCGLTIPWDTEYGDSRDAIMTTLQTSLRAETIAVMHMDGDTIFAPVQTLPNFLSTTNTHLSPTGQAVYAAAVSPLVQALQIHGVNWLSL